MAITGQSDYSFVIDELDNSQDYSFKVSSENRDGEGCRATSASAVQNVLTVNSNPEGNGQQITLTLIHYIKHKVGSLYITVFPSDEGSAILSYNIYRDGVQIANMDTNTYKDHGIKCQWGL